MEITASGWLAGEICHEIILYIIDTGYVKINKIYAHFNVCFLFVTFNICLLNKISFTSFCYENKKAAA
ncbi:hypothetical protein V5799_006141 [Amblyomma americanum]|uniref:Uncharacterized protein n=1 Tax=Amblyomma americanum TaxID=6943 RepID=A0AAQ4DX86_AMBAM